MGGTNMYNLYSNGKVHYVYMRGLCVCVLHSPVGTRVHSPALHKGVVINNVGVHK